MTPESKADAGEVPVDGESPGAGRTASPELIELGLRDYEAALATQREVHAAVAAGERPDALILCEHPLVVTTGRRTEPTAVAGARAAGVPVVDVARGGRATLHLPGQLVGYPILRLPPGRRDVPRLLRALEELLIRLLRELAGLEAGRRERLTGVWTGPDLGRKIASIGIGVERWVTLHGFALNVDCELAKFGLIDPCGLSPSVMTSLARETDEASALAFREAFPGRVAEVLAQSIDEVFAAPAATSAPASRGPATRGPATRGEAAP